MGARQVEPQQTSHSSKFASAKEEIIELQTHNVKPDSIDKYLKAHKNLVDYINSNKDRYRPEEETIVDTYPDIRTLQSTLRGPWQLSRVRRRRGPAHSHLALR